MIPFLFVTIACGAISGFHGLVVVGHDLEAARAHDRRPTDRLRRACWPRAFSGCWPCWPRRRASRAAANGGHHYSSWGAANGLAAKLDAFVTGGGELRRRPRHPLRDGAHLHGRHGDRLRRDLARHRCADPASRALGARGGLRRDRARSRTATSAGALGVGAALLLAVTQGGGTGRPRPLAALRHDQSAGRRRHAADRLDLAEDVRADPISTRSCRWWRSRASRPGRWSATCSTTTRASRRSGCCRSRGTADSRARRLDPLRGAAALHEARPSERRLS